MAAVDSGFKDMEDFYRVAKYHIVKFSDMNSEMREEAMDICITAVEKYPLELEKCTQVGSFGLEGNYHILFVTLRQRVDGDHMFFFICSLYSLMVFKQYSWQMIKEQMDKKFGAAWHVVVGKGFSYEVNYEVWVLQ